MTPLGKLMQAFVDLTSKCKNNEMDKRSLHFFYKSKELEAHDTAKSVGMSDMDVISVTCASNDCSLVRLIFIIIIYSVPQM